MCNDCNPNFLAYNKSAFNELDDIRALVDIAKESCEYRENYAYKELKNPLKLSEERNRYISLFRILADKIARITDLNSYMEEEWLLNKNPDNSCR